jgi:hypothetical protein
MYNVGTAARLQAVRSEIWFPTGASYFSRFPNLHVGPRGLLKRLVWRVQPLAPGIKQPGHEVDHSHPSNAYVRDEWSHISPPLIYVQGVHADNLVTCYLTACVCRILVSNKMSRYHVWKYSCVRCIIITLRFGIRLCFHPQVLVCLVDTLDISAVNPTHRYASEDRSRNSIRALKKAVPHIV